MDAEREVGERLELVVAGWYDLLTLFRTIAEERCIVAHQDNGGDAPAELREDLLDEPCIRLMEGDVDGGKRFVTRRELPPFGEFALRIWVRQLQGVLMPHQTTAEGISDIEGKVARVSGERVGQRPSFKSMHPRISR
ncbi:MAG: hypothetical protein ACJ8KF_09100 [Chthoniobacterales bacterium]